MKATLIDRAAKILCDSFHGSATFDDAAELYKERWIEVARTGLDFWRRRDRIDAAEIGQGRKRGRPPVYNWEGLSVGGAFVMPRDASGKNRFGLAYTSKRYWEQKLNRKFGIKAIDNGLEVRRIV